MSYLPCVELEPTSTADASVIWLHGLGANGHDFEPIVPEFRLPENLNVRFVFPHAPAIPVTINGGMVMPAWYDILDLSIERKFDHQQFMQSAESTRALIDREIERGVSSDRIIVAGFSQGGAVAYQTALTYSRPLAGLLTLSTYFPIKDTIQPHTANKQIPIHVYHGTRDPVVPEILGQNSVKALTELGYQPGYTTYPMEHQVCYEQIQDISSFIQRVLS